MNTFSKSLLFAFASNAFLFLIGFAVPGAFIIMFVIAALEVIIGLFMLIGKETRETGGGLLVAGIVSLLIGISVCSTMPFNFH